jgi:hypothetical protein
LDIDLLVEEIMEAVTSEPESDYGDPKTDYWLRQRAIEARIHDILFRVLGEEPNRHMNMEGEYD